MAERVKGLQVLIKSIEKLKEDSARFVAQITEANARELERNAKRNAPLDTGKLRQSIKAIELDAINYKVQANATGNAPYAPYIEFGTGGLVEVPPELEEIAIQFIGAGVKKIDLKPQPYLYPAFVDSRKQYIKDLEDGLTRLTKKI